MTIQDLEATVRKIYLLGLLYVGLSLGYLMRSPQPFEIPDDPPITVTVTVEDPLDGDPMDAGSYFRSIDVPPPAVPLAMLDLKPLAVPGAEAF